MKVSIILNKNSGTNPAGNEFTEENIKNNFKNSRIEYEIIKTEGKNIYQTVKSKINDDIDAVAVAGGDGSISAAANALADKDTPLAVLPAGTLNHFAKDLEIPFDLEGSVKIISDFKIKKIDLGEVNGKYFINNSSIGLYPKVVKKRIENQRLGGSKWTAMGNAIINVFKKIPLLEVNLESDAENISCRTPFVFIGNNEYFMDLLNLGKRENINKGYLSLYYPNSIGKYSVLKFAFLALINKLDQQKDFSVALTKEIRLTINKPRIEVALDGEVFTLKPPLEYKIKPASLNVIVP